MYKPIHCPNYLNTSNLCRGLGALAKIFLGDLVDRGPDSGLA